MKKPQLAHLGSSFEMHFPHHRTGGNNKLFKMGGERKTKTSEKINRRRRGGVRIKKSTISRVKQNKRLRQK